MRLNVTIKYFLKSLIPSIIILWVFYFGWQDNPDNTRMKYVFIGCVLNSVFFPFSMKIIEKTVLTFTRKEFWQQDFFIDPVGGSLVAVFELFCFALSIPICLIYFLFVLIKALSK